MFVLSASRGHSGRKMSKAKWHYDFNIISHRGVFSVTKNLSYHKKLEDLPILIQRDGGFTCWYCKKELKDQYIYEHLNSNRQDNRIENLVLACQSCNIKKITDFDMQIRARDKLKENEDGNFVREIKPEVKMPTSEIDINMSNSEITRQYLEEVINTDGSIPFSDALNSSAFLCKDKTGHGSQQAIRNYIQMLTSSVAPFMVILDEKKKKIIVKRSGK